MKVVSEDINVAVCDEVSLFVVAGFRLKDAATKTLELCIE